MPGLISRTVGGLSHAPVLPGVSSHKHHPGRSAFLCLEEGSLQRPWMWSSPERGMERRPRWSAGMAGLVPGKPQGEVQGACGGPEIEGGWRSSRKTHILQFYQIRWCWISQAHAPSSAASHQRWVEGTCTTDWAPSFPALGSGTCPLQASISCFLNCRTGSIETLWGWPLRQGEVLLVVFSGLSWQGRPAAPGWVSAFAALVVARLPSPGRSGQSSVPGRPLFLLLVTMQEEWK